MENIWGYILNATIYGSITGLAILIIKSILNKKINKKYAYLLWMILIVKLVMPFGPESNLSLFNKIPVSINKNVNSTSQIKIPTYIEENYNANSDTPTSREEASSISSAEAINDSNSFINIVPFIWITGAILTLGAHIIFYLFFLKHMWKNSREDKKYLEKVLLNCQKRLHIKRKIQVVIDDMISSPSLIGIWKVKILMPSTLIDLSENELQHIFLHELCHYKNKDTIINNIIIFLQCVHWFNPLMWFLFKKMKNDMEMACDERVLSVLQEEEHNKYGLTMLTVLEKISFPKKLSVGLNMADDKKTIKKRVELIKNAKHFTKKKKIFTITGMICLIVLCGILLTNEKTLVQDEDNTILSKYTKQGESKDLEKAISKVIIDKYASQLFPFDVVQYGMDLNVDTSGELPVESHVILGQDEDDDSVEVYLMASYGSYEFENGIFNMTSGTWNIPMKIKFSKVKEGEFILTDGGYYYLDSEEAEDGEQHKSSVEKMFPKSIAYKALNNDYADQLNKDVQNQAVVYVKSLGRESQVSHEYVQKEYIDELAMVDISDIEELENYPNWIGTREELENNKRYIYETDYDKSSSIVTYTKYDDKKVQIEMLQYKIKGDKLEEIELKK
ncbi:MAG: M56 family metallopeptidase [Terrisporobacter sp.]|uniref:M56 family metallopeptidase n=1 Tax=Terrisporobacter sp. TaxID=1965305 RepID=UPI002FCB53A4